MCFKNKCDNGNNCVGSRCPSYEAKVGTRISCTVFGMVSKEKNVSGYYPSPCGKSSIFCNAG